MVNFMEYELYLNFKKSANVDWKSDGVYQFFLRAQSYGEKPLTVFDAVF